MTSDESAARPAGIRVLSTSGSLLSVPLREPFVIASGRIDVTRAVMISVTVGTPDGVQATGFGEAAALPPVTREDQPELMREIGAAAPTMAGAHLSGLVDLERLLARAVPGSVIARAAFEAAVLDAWARTTGLPLGRWLARATAPSDEPTAEPDGLSLITDITLPIAPPDEMAKRAARHAAAGFTCFKVKVGLNWQTDRDGIEAIAKAVPGARFRLDANGGFLARDALALLDAVLGEGLMVDCFEQPCARDDWSGMAEVTAHSSVPVVADESFRDGADLDRLQAERAAHAVNLKLVKLGGPLRALALGRRARAAGLGMMAGAMVETRLGLLAMAHVVSALGGVDWVDLDTAFLLGDDPFEGGWTADGPCLALTGGPGLDVVPKKDRQPG